MSKSLENVYTISQLQEKGIEPLAFKLLCYTAHYRTKLNFTFDGASSSQKALNRLRESYIKHRNGNEEISAEEINAYKEKFLDAINDDLNIPLAMSIIWEIARNEKKSKKLADLLDDFDKVLALDLCNSEKYIKEQENIEIPEEVLELVKKRKKAREEKDWDLSDELRDKIKGKGYVVKDTKKGMTIEKM